MLCPAWMWVQTRSAQPPLSSLPPRSLMGAASLSVTCRPHLFYFWTGGVCYLAHASSGVSLVVCHLFFQKHLTIALNAYAFQRPQGLDLWIWGRACALCAQAQSFGLAQVHLLPVFLLLHGRLTGTRRARSAHRSLASLCRPAFACYSKSPSAQCLSSAAAQTSRKKCAQKQHRLFRPQSGCPPGISLDPAPCLTRTSPRVCQSPSSLTVLPDQRTQECP